MAQTAVENIIEKLQEQIRKSAHNKLGTNRTGDYRFGLIKAIDLCKQAKEMEKEQIMNAWAKGVTSENNVTAEQCYKETFKKDQAKEMEKDTVKAKEETLAAEISLRIDGVLTRFIHEDEYKSIIDAYEKEVKELHDRIRNQSKIIKDSMDVLGKINSLIK
jgi:hypothetical protein